MDREPLTPAAALEAASLRAWRLAADLRKALRVERDRSRRFVLRMQAETAQAEHDAIQAALRDARMVQTAPGVWQDRPDAEAHLRAAWEAHGGKAKSPAAR